MGLGPMMAIFQARFTRYLEHRGLVKPSDRKVWAFPGDGEMDEPESMGALTMPVREGLDNLIFVINCKLQRLDGPVRGNGKIIQELEAACLGAGWNVIKVLWGSRWDPLRARDTHGLLRRVMEECVDGEYQNFKAKGGAYTREHFFGKYPELKAMVANMSDEEIWRLNRGGHDPRKVYAAYAAAAAHNGQPTVILAKTVKGFGLGKGGEGQMIAHQAKKMSEEDVRAFRDRFNIPVSDEDLGKLPFRKPDAETEEARYLNERRTALGSFLPTRRRTAPPLVIPPPHTFGPLLERPADPELSTTVAVVRALPVLHKATTAGRTTLAGEGLQHQDGHSQLLASTVPNCVAYDPTYAYELAVIIHDGLRRMYAEQERVFYYITVMNENYPQPALPAGVEAGILAGGYLLLIGSHGKVRATLLGSGTILRECLAAAKILENDYGIPADVLSVTSFSELRREALECERWNLLHPGEEPRTPYARQMLKGREGPVIAATDYMRTVPDQIRQWVEGRYVTLGTDGFGRSDSRAALRRHFEVDRNYIAVAALKALADESRVDRATVEKAIKALGIDPAKPVPWKV